MSKIKVNDINVKCKTADGKVVTKKIKTYCVFAKDDQYSYNLIFKDSSNPLNRMIQHFNEGCMIIGAERHERSPEENAQLSRELEQDLRARGLGYRPSLGGYVENLGEDEETRVEETSFLIPKPADMSNGEFLEIGLELGKKYSQESILVSLPSINNGKPSYVLTTGANAGTIDMDFDKFHITKPSDQYYTKEKRHGKSITFDSVKQDSNHNEYRFVADSRTELSDVLEYYSHYELVHPAKPTERFDKGYYWKDGILFPKEK